MAEPRVAVIACGAIAQLVAAGSARESLPVEVHPLPPLLHNSPQLIAAEVERLADELIATGGVGLRVAVAYADCGTYGALDELCERRRLARLPGLHCYDVFAGAERIEELLAQEPGTYLLTDFLVRSFARTVIQELGLDRHPELREDYFRHYERVVWLVQTQEERERAELEVLAQDAAARIGLPLEVVSTGTAGLDRALVALVRTSQPPHPHT